MDYEKNIDLKRQRRLENKKNFFYLNPGRLKTLFATMLGLIVNVDDFNISI